MKLDRRKLAALTLTGSLVLMAGACSDDVTGPDTDTDVAALFSMDPAAGSVDVAVGSSVTVTFDHAIGVGMDE